MKQFALFDFDKTLYDGFSLLELLDTHVRDGLIDREVIDSIHDIMRRHDAGETDYETMASAQLECYAQSLKGLTYEQVFQSSVKCFKLTTHIFPFARPTIELLDRTHETALITALPEHAAKAAAAAVGVTGVYSSELELSGGVFTGNVSVSLTAKGGKRACVTRIENEHTMENSFVFGDSEGDIEMLRTATYPICVNPSDGLRKEAKAGGWHICAPSQVERTVRELL